MSKRAIGQFFAVASVVVSLVFVGYEIRQNTQVARMASYHAIMAERTDFFLTLSTDPILTPLLASMEADAVPQDFEFEDRIRLTTFIGANLSIWEGVYASVNEGLLPTEMNAALEGR